MKEIRIGLIGLGGIINMHVEQIEKNSDLSIVAVCDLDINKVNEWGERYNLKPDKRYTEHKQLIEDSEVDAIISATSNDAHYDIIKSCMLAEKPLMTEKPFTKTYSEAKRLLDISKRNQSDCFVGFSYRYVPSFRMAREWIRSGKIGQVRHVSVQYLQEWGVPLHETPMNWRWDPAITGTGVLHDLGTHMIDAARFLVAEPLQVRGLLKNLISERPAATGKDTVEVNIDDFAGFIAILEGEIPAVFQTSRNAFGSGNQLEVSIYGDLGTLHMGYEYGDTLIWIRQDEAIRSKIKEEVTVPENYKLIQMQDFVHFVRNGGSDSTPTLIDGYKNQLALEAIIQSDKQGRIIQLEDIEDKEERASI